MKRLHVYDIETLKTLFCIVLKNVETKEIIKFEISNRKNQLEELINYLLNNISGMIGFNNLFFDYPIIHYIIKNRKLLNKLPSNEVVKILYNLAQDIIQTGNDERNKYKYQIPDWNHLIPQMDLYKIWHFDNKAKRTSLKKIEFAIRWNVVLDMPYMHYDDISMDKFDEIIDYCINDVEATYEFYLITRGQTELPLYKNKDKIQLRIDIRKKTGLNCINWNDVKIGDEINKLKYLSKTGLTWQDIKGKNTKRAFIDFKDCIADFIKFESKELNDFLERLKNITVNGTKSEFTESIKYKGVEFTFGQGGIHSVDKPRLIIPKEGWKLQDRDVGSMYPRTLIIQKLYPAHLGKEWIIGIEDNYEERMINKPLGKDKSLSEDKRREAVNWAETLKLAMNGGGYGKTGEENSWQYDILVMLTTTITNQLALMMLAERYLNNDMQVISANTDGIVLYYPENKQHIVDQIDKEWQEITQYVLEYTDYVKFIQTSVNDYITLKPNGELKFKGDFEIEKEIHKNHSMKIVPMALKEYFINNIPIEDTILNHNDILDFCKCANMTGENILYERTYDVYGQEILKKLSKTTRYYVSNDGNTLIKKLPPLKKDDQIEIDRKKGQLSLFDFVPDVKVDLDRETNIEAGYVNTVFNTIVRKPIKDYNINYNYYFNECYKIINKIKLYND